ncbi:hypothetical protein O3M35_011000 [Rhynocoris fuscipes]|uniref:Protein takeout n=1 Tax=Rhynocoris fuscipes TaxID=488301 RepID=A0AAW1D469_9HEMI
MSRADCYTLTICSLLFAVNIFTDETEASKLPKTWKICKKSDPNMNECLKEAVNMAVHELTQGGNPSLGVLSMDPLRMNTLSIKQGTGPVSINLDFTEIDVIGLKNFEVMNIRTDWKDMDIEGRVKSQLVLDGKYKIDGKVLVLPVTGEGHCRIIFDNIHTKAHKKLKETSKNGKRYYEVTGEEFEFDVDKVHLHFDNLFNGDKTLGDTTNAFINENWKEIFMELKPSISTIFGTLFKEISNRIFSKITVEELSPA